MPVHKPELLPSSEKIHYFFLMLGISPQYDNLAAASNFHTSEEFPYYVK
jgi:hypothetical protein